MSEQTISSGGWLVASGLSLEYERGSSGERFVALDDINLSVDEGEFVSLVGPSGCGKTSLLRIINCLLEPTGGEVLLSGRPISQSSQDRAMVFQDASLFPWFTVGRNVGYGLECQGVSVRDARSAAQDYIELVGLRGFEDHYPHELSGGMQQRANLARALTVGPAVLLADEPFAALDAQTREFMQVELLRIWQQEKKTVIFVTHQIEEALYLSDRVLVMSARPGSLVDDVTVDLPRPRDLKVKRSSQFQGYQDRIWRQIEQQASESMGALAQPSGERR